MPKNKKKDIELTLDMMLKMTPETFIAVMKNQPRGFKMSLLNLLKMQYEQCNVSKDAITKMMVEEVIPTEEQEQANKTIQDLYICMQLLEDRHNILDIILNEGNVE